MARDPAIDQPVIATVQSAEAGKPNQVDDAAVATAPGSYGEGADPAYWIACLEDAERAEKDWRTRGREIVEIYRNQARNRTNGAITLGKVNFNILYANTEVMLPAVYSKPPEPVVKSRFVKLAPPMPPQPPMPPPGMTPPGAPPGAPMAPPAAAPPGMPPGAPMPTPMPQPGPASAVPPTLAPQPGLPPGMGMPPGAMGAPMSPAAPGVPPGLPQGPMMPPPGMPQPAPGRPDQVDIETAASVMQTVLAIVVEDENSNEAVKGAVKDVLLPGRGVCRVRWRPQMEQKPVMAGDGTTPLLGDDGQPQTQDVKVWEEVGDEYVYWEDLLVDPVRAVADMNWIAFRHLFTKEALDQEFSDSPEYQKLVATNRLDGILKWTDESAAKSPVGGGSALKTADTLGDHIRKAMVWEVWDRRARKILWFIREASGVVLRVDEDSYQLMGFYPIPAPMLAVTTTDTRVPRAYYDLYAKMAGDLDETSTRISQLIRQIKVRGAYNSASRDIADILTAADGKMMPVDGVDMANGGLENHIWMVPIDPWAAALDKLMVAKEHLKQSIYEIMGISDIMRGATKASETATAQRIKGSMGVSRLEDAKSAAANFARDLLRLKAEIIGQNFAPETLEAMTGEAITPGVIEILRSDFQRMCAIDIETDSTVAVDEQAEQQSMAQIMTAVQGVMMGTQSMLQVQFLPPIQVMQLSMELLKMFLHPIRYSRPVVAMLNDLQEQLRMLAMMPPPPPPPMAPPGAAPGEPAGAAGPGPAQAAPAQPPGMSGRNPDLQSPLAA